MSNDVNNLAHSFVAMAQAFEQLPIVRAELESAKQAHAIDGETIQRLELRVMDLKAELDEAHANTRKVEVERDHAERMFLETDDRLNAFRRLLGSFQTEAGALIAAAEPVANVQVATSPTQGHEAVIEEHQRLVEEKASNFDPGPAIGDAFTLGQGEPHPTDTSSVSEQAATAGTSPVLHTDAAHAEGVSVSADPTPVTESSSESGLSGSGSQGLREPGEYVPSMDHTPASAPTVSPTSDTVQSSLHSEDERVSDPTASSTAGDGHSPSNATPTTDAIDSAGANTQAPMPTAPSEPIDDVGYHNEPKIVGTGAEAWQDWDKWCERMNKRYPHSAGGWPPRSQAVAQ